MPKRRTKRTNKKRHKKRIHRLAGGKSRRLSGRHRSNVWLTPPYLVERIRTTLRGRIDLDPCTEPSNPVGARLFYTAAQNGLGLPWAGSVYCNPPYTDLSPWVDRAIEAAESDARVVFLSPARIDAAHHQRLLRSCTDFLLLAGRVRFLDADGSAQQGPVFGSILYGLGLSMRPMADLGVLCVPTAFGSVA